MNTITAIDLRQLLCMVPDNTPVYIVGEHNENGIVLRRSDPQRRRKPVREI